MPRDDWGKCRRRDGERRRACNNARSSAIAHWKLLRDMTPKDCSGRFNSNTMLWFGEHKGKMIREVPEKYLRWIASKTDWTAWRMVSLAKYLRARQKPSAA